VKEYNYSRFVLLAPVSQ